MKRLKNILNADKKVVSIFFTAGYPKLNRINQLCEILEKAGVQLIEIGIPSSDPLADGPVIQQSSTIALENGMTMEILFKELRDIRKSVSIPILLMGYYNQVLQFGGQKIMDEALKCELDGFIIPDQPIESKFSELCRQNNLANVRMICPTTSANRIKELDKISTGFLYAVSTSTTTGNNKSNAAAYLEELSNYGLQNLIMTGFGIRDNSSFESATKHTQGGIIGTAFVELISDENNINQEKINQFVSQFKISTK